MTGYTGLIEPETSAIVVGCGAVGLIAVQEAQLCGASIIVSVDINPLKLESARRVGARHVVDASEEVAFPFNIRIGEPEDRAHLLRHVPPGRQFSAARRALHGR